MKLILSTHNVTLSETLKDRVVKRLEQIDHMDGRAVDARMTLEIRPPAHAEKTI